MLCDCRQLFIYRVFLFDFFSFCFEAIWPIWLLLLWHLQLHALLFFFLPLNLQGLLLLLLFPELFLLFPLLSFLLKSNGFILLSGKFASRSSIYRLVIDVVKWHTWYSITLTLLTKWVYARLGVFLNLLVFTIIISWLLCLKAFLLLILKFLKFTFPDDKLAISRCTGITGCRIGSYPANVCVSLIG